MNHMHISGIEPCSVILRQTKYSKILKFDTSIMPKQVEAERDGVINPQVNNFNRFETWKTWMLSKRY